MQTNAVKIQVEIPFDDLFSIIERLPEQQKLILFERLKMLAFKERWALLSKEIVSPGFTEEEIAAEIRAFREN